MDRVEAALFGSFWGKVLRRAHAILPADMEDAVESHLEVAEYLDFLALDLVVRGQLRGVPDTPEVWLAVEMSSAMDQHDVERAIQRAAYLGKAGLRALPAVAGSSATAGAEKLAKKQGAVVNLNGQISY